MREEREAPQWERGACVRLSDCTTRRLASRAISHSFACAAPLSEGFGGRERGGGRGRWEEREGRSRNKTTPLGLGAWASGQDAASSCGSSLA